MISMGQPHRAVPLTGGMCLAVAANLTGGLVHRLSRPNSNGAKSAVRTIRMGTSSGSIPIGATVLGEGANSHVERVTVYRTARRLMEGNVLIPG